MEKRDFNSNVNQDIKGKFIGREVYCNVGMMVQELIEFNYQDCDKGIDIYEYLTPFGIYDNEELTEEARDEKIEEIEERANNIESIVSYYETEKMFDKEFNYASKIEKGSAFVKEFWSTIEDLENMDFDEYPEIFEYYTVSDFLAEKLKEKGHVIIDDYYCKIWGRETSGQAILLDYVISEICNEMEILDGQECSWAKSK